MKAIAEAILLVGVIACLSTCQIMRDHEDNALKIAKLQAECPR